MSSTDAQQRGNVSDKGDLTQQQPFRLLDLPAELWMRCCRFAILQHDGLDDGETGPVIFFEQEEREPYLGKKTTPPAITRTCAVVRKETLKIFYGTIEFCFVDENQNFLELRDWVMDGWTTYWPLVKQCTVKSKYCDIQDHTHDFFGGKGVVDRKRVAFYGAPPSGGKETVFRLTVEDKADAVLNGESDARDGKS